MTASQRVVLIGGTSHVGKSSLANRVAQRFGWKVLSTDQFARHPGRPWRDDPDLLPDDVRAYFQGRTTAQLLESVLGHYRSNVMPIAKAVIESHLNNRFDPCLVLEGSALLPADVQSLGADQVLSIWLAAPDDALRSRIYHKSQYDQRVAEDQMLIERFCDRTLAYGQWLTAATQDCGFTQVDSESSRPMSTIESWIEAPA